MERKDKKVLFAISNIAIGGGAEKVVTTIASEFLARGISTTLLTFYSAPQEHNFAGERLSMHEATPASLLGKLPRALQRIRYIKRVCKEKDIDVVISFLEESNYYTLLSKILLGNKVRIIVSVRNDPKAYNSLYKVLIRTLYPFADMVVAVTKGVEQSLKESFDLERTTTIYNPVDTKVIEEKLKKSLPVEHTWIKNRKPLVLTIGRLAQQKGQWHLIQAFSEVVKQSSNATLLIVGEGPYKERLQRLIDALNLSGNVFLLGKQENVFPFLREADIFVLPSLWEGMPNALLEAIAIGLPSMVTDASTGPREILAPELSIDQKIVYPYKNTQGVLVQPFSGESEITGPPTPYDRLNEEKLAISLCKILESENIKNPSENQRLSIESIVNKWEGLI